MHSTNTDYQVVIRMPCVEYQVPAHNFLFIKPLTRSEARSFFLESFEDWDKRSIQVLMQFKKFQELVAPLGRSNPSKAGQNIYQLESSGNL
jgi:hypothetical protein